MTSGPYPPLDHADAADIPGLDRDQTDAAHELLTELAERLNARKVIDQAMQILMTQTRMTEPEAYRWIQKGAMDRRTPMVLIATTIVEGFDQNASRAS